MKKAKLSDQRKLDDAEDKVCVIKTDIYAIFRNDKLYCAATRRDIARDELKVLIEHDFKDYRERQKALDKLESTYEKHTYVFGYEDYYAEKIYLMGGY